MTRRCPLGPSLAAWCAAAAFLAGPLAGAGAPRRPGNVFTAGEEVSIPYPVSARPRPIGWRVLDDLGHRVAAGAISPYTAPPERIALGRLPVGWYRIELGATRGRPAGWTTAAVLAPLRVPPPEETPVGVDAAVSWFASGDPEGQRAFARLAALAGAGWVRDRLRWRDIEPARGALAAAGNYDQAAAIQAAAGLRVLQVFHDTPPWAVDRTLDGERATGRFPRDLRDVRRAARELAARLRGRVRAWEPWNEPNIPNFGGHPLSEIAAYQKAAWLGFKEGDPEALVAWCAMAAVPSPVQAEGVRRNEAWPYFDAYDIHSYDWPESYLELWAPAREAACGRPIWVTEADRGLRYVTPPPAAEHSREGELRKAELIARAYASSLFAGAARHFHFILGSYTESQNKVQFGLLRLDRTPRPAYVALAAVGRFLAGARCLGRWLPGPDGRGRAVAFRARPDGEERVVLVAWCAEAGEWESRGRARTAWSLPPGLRPIATHDLFGRELPELPAELTPRSIFVLLDSASADRLPLEPPPAPSARLPGAPSPVVLQPLLPRAAVRQRPGGRPWSHDREIALEPGREHRLSIALYNFQKGAARGRIALEERPDGWTVELDPPASREIALRAGERRLLSIRIAIPPRGPTAPPRGRITIRGEFAAAGRPVTSFVVGVKEARKP